MGQTFLIAVFAVLHNSFNFCVCSFGNSSPNIARVIKSRRMRLAGHVAGMGEERGVYGVLAR